MKIPFHHEINAMSASEAATQLVILLNEWMDCLLLRRELERRYEIEDMLVDIMRYNGASERSIQKALPAIQEFAEYSKMLPGYLASDKPEEQEHPTQTSPSDAQEDELELGNQSASLGAGQKVA